MENYKHLFPAAQPPYGVEASGGTKNRPEYIVPVDDWWPDLTKPLTPVVEITAAGVQEHPENGSYGGSVSATAAEGLTLSSEVGTVNGIYIDGCEYTISHADIQMSGDGKDDFAGIGAAIMAVNDSHVTLRDSTVEMTGPGKSCFLNTKGSTLIVKRCNLICNGGPLPEGYTYTVGPGMLEPPVGLKLGGTARATLTTDNGKTYYYDSTIVADGWAALSTDAAMGNLYMEATRCTAITKGNGYVLYSDAGCHVVINDCDFVSGNVMAVMANEAELVLNNVRSTSGKAGIMVHNVLGWVEEAGLLTIHGGIHVSQEEFLQLLSVNTYIDIDGADITCRNGVFAHSEINNNSKDRTPVDGKTVYGHNIVLSNMTLAGDILHEDYERTMSVNMSCMDYTGALKNVYLTMDHASKWTATGDSTVVLMGDIHPEQIDGNGMITIHAHAGEGCTLSGTYALESGGKLVFDL